MLLNRIFFLGLLLLLAGCGTLVRGTSSPRTYETSSGYVELSEQEMIRQADLIVVGTITAVSGTRWNQDSGDYWEETVSGTLISATPLHTIDLQLEEQLHGDINATETITLFLSNKSPADSGPIRAGTNGTLIGSVVHGLQVGDTVLAFVREGEIGWWDGPGSIQHDASSGAVVPPRKSVLMPLGNPATTLLPQAEDGRFHPQIATTQLSPLSLETLIPQLSTPQPSSQPAATPTPTQTPLPASTNTPTPTAEPNSEPDASNKGLLYYSAVNGHYYRTTLTGNEPEQLTLEPDVGHIYPDLIEQTLSGFSPPRISPNGRYLLQHGGNGQWRLIDLQTKQMLKESSDDDHFFALSWAPDSTRFAVIRNWHEVCIFTLDATRERCLWHSEATLIDAAWSPNGRFIAVAKADARTDLPHCCPAVIWMIDPETSQSFRADAVLASHEPSVNSTFQWLPNGNALIIHSLPQGGAALYFPESATTLRLPGLVSSASPNGRLFYSHAGFLMDDDGQSGHQLIDPNRCLETQRRLKSAWSPDGSKIAVATTCTLDEDPFEGEWELALFDTASGQLLWQKTLPQTFTLLTWANNDLLLRHQTSGWPIDSRIMRLAADGADEPTPIVDQALFLGFFSQWTETTSQ